MLRRTLAGSLLVATLCAAPAAVPAVTVPLSEGTAPGGHGLEIEISLEALSRSLASARMSGLGGSRPAQPNAAYAVILALAQAALAKMPWLSAAGRANGLWTWRSNPTLGVAIYGPGTGGYNSFSWSRSLPETPTARPRVVPLVDARWIPAANNPATSGSPSPVGAGTPPAPVPLPPAAPMLVGGLAVLAILRRLRK